jgi:hypothetical protein
MDDMLGLQYWETDIASNGKSIPLYFSLSSNDSALATLVRFLLGVDSSTMWLHGFTSRRWLASTDSQLQQCPNSQSTMHQHMLADSTARITASPYSKGELASEAWNYRHHGHKILLQPLSSDTIYLETVTSSFSIETSYFCRVVLI